MKPLDQFINELQYIIRHYDDVEAKKSIKDLESFIVSQSIEQRDPNLYQQLQALLVHLKIVAIPQLSDEEVASVLKDHYLESFDIEIDMENRLTGKLFLIPEIPRDALRERLKRALMANMQKLGNLTISQWIYEFEKSYPVKTRNMSASVDFVVSSPQARMLNPIQKEQLKEMLHVYDYLLVTTLPATGPALTDILNMVSSQEIENSEIEDRETPYNNLYVSDVSMKQTVPSNPENLVKMTLQEALRKYPELGEQIITPLKITLKSFPQPVRPSIKNWISDYTFNVGYDSHNSIVRNNYLFKNPNTQYLSAQDRNRLAYLLKAFDENEMVSVDVNGKEIIFPSAEVDRQQNVSSIKQEDGGSNERVANFRMTNDDFRQSRQEISNNFPNSNSQISKPAIEIIPNRNIQRKENSMDGFGLKKEPASLGLEPSRQDESPKDFHREMTAPPKKMTNAPIPESYAKNSPKIEFTPRKDLTLGEKPVERGIPSSNFSPKETNKDHPQKVMENRVSSAMERIKNTTPSSSNNKLEFKDNTYFANLSPSYNKNVTPAKPTMDFSSPQRLPHEKVIQPEEREKEQEETQPGKPASYPPLKIGSSLTYNQEEKRPNPKNVVNLKNNDE